MMVVVEDDGGKIRYGKRICPWLVASGRRRWSLIRVETEIFKNIYWLFILNK
jgi:hypothetical protein